MMTDTEMVANEARWGAIRRGAYCGPSDYEINQLIDKLKGDLTAKPSFQDGIDTLTKELTISPASRSWDEYNCWSARRYWLHGK